MMKNCCSNSKRLNKKNFFLFNLIVALIFCFVLSFFCGCNVKKNDENENKKEIVSLQIISYPTRQSYISGDKFNSDGLLIQANYSDGSKKNIPTDRLVFDKDTEFTDDTTKIEITYEGISIDIPIVMYTVSRISMSNSIEADSIFPSKLADFSDKTSAQIVYSNDATKVIDNYGLQFDFQPQEGESDIDNFTVENISNVSFPKKGNYVVKATFGTFVSEESFNIDVYNGFKTEAENIYDSSEVIGAIEDYAYNLVPSDVLYYSQVESVVTGDLWRDNFNGMGVRYLLASKSFPRPLGDYKMDNCSGGKYLGDLSALKVFSVHFYSEIDIETEIVMTAASAMIDSNKSYDIPVNKMFDIYFGNNSFNKENESFNESNKISLKNEDVLKGTVFNDVENLDQKTTHWSKVSLGKIQLKKGDNVLYFHNIYTEGDPAFAGVQCPWLMNIDCFELNFS